jgi:hypothetical protein
MPKKKSTTSTVDTKPKVKGLFDHINHLREGRNPKYFDTLSEADQKSWSNYMVCRFLSMDPRCIDMVNEIQKYHPSTQGVLSVVLGHNSKGSCLFSVCEESVRGKVV